MQNDWDAAIAFVLEQEGGYSNDPNDPGGETNFGISKKQYPSLDIKSLTVEQAKTIYRKDFWEACACDQLASPFAIATFDCAVNQGVGRAIRLLQISLGVIVDGEIGDQTISATFKTSARTIKKLLAERLAEYQRIIIANQKLIVFAVNWNFRVISLAELIFKQQAAL